MRLKPKNAIAILLLFGLVLIDCTEGREAREKSNLSTVSYKEAARIYEVCFGVWSDLKHDEFEFFVLPFGRKVFIQRAQKTQPWDIRFEIGTFVDEIADGRGVSVEDNVEDNNEIVFTRDGRLRISFRGEKYTLTKNRTGLDEQGMPLMPILEKGMYTEITKCLRGKSSCPGVLDGVWCSPERERLKAEPCVYKVVQDDSILVFFGLIENYSLKFPNQMSVFCLIDDNLVELFPDNGSERKYKMKDCEMVLFEHEKEKRKIKVFLYKKRKG